MVVPRVVLYLCTQSRDGSSSDDKARFLRIAAPLFFCRLPNGREEATGDSQLALTAQSCWVGAMLAAAAAASKAPLPRRLPRLFAS